MVELDVNNPTIAYGVLGFFLVQGFFLDSVLTIIDWIKQRLFLSGSIVALLVGIITGPYVLDWVNPLDWAENDVEAYREITFEVTRVVIALQVLFTGIALPKAYLRRSWRSLAMLLLPIMTIAYLVSGLLIWGLFPGLSFLEALCIGACITPTDPVLAAAIVKGRFAEENVPRDVRNLIAAESGANDGLGCVDPRARSPDILSMPAVSLAVLYLAVYLIDRPTRQWSIAHALSEWILNTWLFQIALSVLAGAIIGFIARKTLKFAEQRRLIEHESFLAYGIGLALLCCGTVGLLGSDDLLCAFIAGNSFTWVRALFLLCARSIKMLHRTIVSLSSTSLISPQLTVAGFRVETEEHSFQDVIDNLLDSAVFIYIGTIIPWSQYNNLDADLSVWRYILFGVLIMLVRRLPWVLAAYRLIPDISNIQEAAFLGWFGPIGVSAIYYVQVALSHLPEDRLRLRDLLEPVAYFAVLTSVIVHGVTVALTKLGARTYTRTRSLGTGQQSGSSTPRPAAPLVGTIALPKAPESSLKLEQARHDPALPRSETWAGVVHFSERDGDKISNET